jgi:hypothetical protein
MVTPAAGRITIQNTDRSREYPPPDAVPDFAATWDRALQAAEMLGVRTNEMERSPDGSIHLRKTENTTSHLGGSIKYTSKRSVTVFRNIGGFLARSLDGDKIELELGVNGRLLKFNFKWPNIEVTSTNRVLALPQIMDRIKKGYVLADPLNEYPPGSIAQIELTDYQVFYYVSTMLPYGRRSMTVQTPDIQPMIEFLATFKSSSGETRLRRGSISVFGNVAGTEPNDPSSEVRKEASHDQSARGQAQSKTWRRFADPLCSETSSKVEGLCRSRQRLGLRLASGAFYYSHQCVQPQRCLPRRLTS